MWLTFFGHCVISGFIVTKPLCCIVTEIVLVRVDYSELT